MVLLGRGARDKKLDGNLHSSRPSSSSLFSLHRKESDSSLAASVAGTSRPALLHRKPSASSLFSLNRLGSRGSDASAFANRSHDQAASLSFEQARAPPKAARVLGLDQPPPESFAQAWLRRGKNLKRHASKLSLTSSIGTLDDNDHGSPGPTISAYDDSRPGSFEGNGKQLPNGWFQPADSIKASRSPSISLPSNFKHVTHTQPSHFRKFVNGQMSDNDLLAEFSALRAGQHSRSQLRGIKAGDLHSRSDSYATSAATSAMSSPRPRSPCDSAMSSLSAAYDTFLQPSSSPPLAPPPVAQAFHCPAQASDLTARRHPDQNFARGISIRDPRRPTPNFSRNSTALASRLSTVFTADQRDARSEASDMCWEPSTSWSFPLDVILPPVTEEGGDFAPLVSQSESRDTVFPSPRLSGEAEEVRPPTTADASNPDSSLDHSVSRPSGGPEPAALSAPIEGQVLPPTVHRTAATQPSNPASGTKPLAKPPKSILKKSTELDANGCPKRPKLDVHGVKQSAAVAFARDNLSPRSVRNMSSSNIPQLKSAVVPPRHAKVQAELDQLQDLLTRLEAEATVRQESKSSRPQTADFTAIIGTADFTLGRSAPAGAQHRRQRTVDATVSHYSGSSQCPAPEQGSQKQPPRTPLLPILSSPGSPPKHLPPSPPLTPQQASMRSSSRPGSAASVRTTDGRIAPSKIPLPINGNHRRGSSSASINSPTNHSLFPSPPEPPPSVQF